jgi:mono/diheme cytochrome c family protein
MSSRLLRSLSSLSIVIAALALAGCGSDTGTSSGTTGGGDDAVAKGAALVKTDACAGCHTSSKEGEVLSGQDSPYTGKQYGANLTPDKDTGIGGWTDAQIGDAITKGVDDEGAMLCDAMPRFSHSEEEVAQIIAYLKSIPAVSHAVTESECAP